MACKASMDALHRRMERDDLCEMGIESLQLAGSKPPK
jgi:hypothetical protein